MQNISDIAVLIWRVISYAAVLFFTITLIGFTVTTLYYRHLFLKKYMEKINDKRA